MERVGAVARRRLVGPHVKSAADEWWESLSPERRDKVYRWIAQPQPETGEHPDQLTIFEEGIEA